MSALACAIYGGGVAYAFSRERGWLGALLWPVSLGWKIAEWADKEEPQP